MATTYAQPIALNAGSSHSGLAASVVATVKDSAGTLQATVIAGWVESPAGSGCYANSFNRDPVWGAVSVVYTITGQAGFGVSEVIQPVSISRPVTVTD
jgi:hypothetical protein